MRTDLESFHAMHDLIWIQDCGRFHVMGCGSGQVVWSCAKSLP